MILALILEDGTMKKFGIGDSVQSLVRAIRDNEVETIVAGLVTGEKVEWEKQFQACTVMPTSFGAKQ